MATIEAAPQLLRLGKDLQHASSFVHAVVDELVPIDLPHPAIPVLGLDSEDTAWADHGVVDVPRLPPVIHVFEAVDELEAEWLQHSQQIGDHALAPVSLQDVAARLTAAQIAADHSCSDDIVLYRIKRMRLWQRYVSYAA
jgi:hypothetical protein